MDGLDVRSDGIARGSCLAAPSPPIRGLSALACRAALGAEALLLPCSVLLLCAAAPLCPAAPLLLCCAAALRLPC